MSAFAFFLSLIFQVNKVCSVKDFLIGIIISFKNISMNH